MKFPIICLVLGIGVSLSNATLVLSPINITGGTASQSTSHPAGPAGNGIDGNLGNFTHTNGGDPAPSWSVDFGVDHTFSNIIVHNRAGCCADRLSDITVEAFDSGSGSVYNSGVLNPGNSLGNPAFLDLSFADITARSITVSRDPASTPNAGVLSIGELQIGAVIDQTLAPGTNLTQTAILGMSVSQSSQLSGFAPGLATDNNFGNFTHTVGSQAGSHWWQVDFGEEMDLESVSMFNRTSCCGERLRDITVTVLDGMGTTVFTSALLNPENALAGPAQMDVDFQALNGGVPIVGQTVVITRTPDPDNSGNPGGNADDGSVLSLGEVQVFGATIIPEPSSVALLGLAFAFFARRRR